jgi:hypothetical protein
MPFIINPRQFRLRLAKDYAWGNPPEKYDVKLELYLNCLLTSCHHSSTYSRQAIVPMHKFG